MGAKAISTGHTARALDFYKGVAGSGVRNDLYFVIAKPADWPDPENPPVVTTETELIEPFGWKKVEQLLLVKPNLDNSVTSDTISYNSTNWIIQTEAQFIADKSRWVYVRTTINYGDFDGDLTDEERALGKDLSNRPYTQVGLASYVSVVQGLNRTGFREEHILNKGLIEIIDNRKKVSRDSSVSEQLSFIIEF